MESKKYKVAIVCLSWKHFLNWEKRYFNGKSIIDRVNEKFYNGETEYIFIDINNTKRLRGLELNEAIVDEYFNQGGIH